MIEGIKTTDRISVDVRMPQIDYSEEKISSLKHDIAKKYGVPLRNVDVNFVPLSLSEGNATESVIQEVIDNIQDPTFHIKLFEDYINSNGIKDADISVIRDIDTKVNAYVDFNKYAKYKPYKIKSARWSNFASYGPDNYFDFTTLHGLVHLMSVPGNQGGKTTFAIHLIRFALFGKSEKMKNLSDVFNSFLPEATEAFVEVVIEVDGCEYVIKRTLTRPALKKRTAKSKVTQKVEFFKVENGNRELLENCEGESNTQTNSIIRESIGSMDDFDLVIAATAYSIDSLLNLGQTERGRIFSRWMGLLSIEEKEGIAKELWKKQVSPSLVSNRYNRSELAEEIALLEERKKAADDAIENANSEAMKSDERIALHEAEKNDAIRERRAVSDTANNDMITINNCLSDKKAELERKRENFSVKKQEYLSVKDASFIQEDYDELVSKREAEKNTKHSIEVENEGFRVEIMTLKKQEGHIRDLVSKGVCPECGQPVSHASQEGQLSEILGRVKVLTDNGVRNKGLIMSSDNEITRLTEAISSMEKERERTNKRQRLEPTLVAIKANLDKIKLEIEDYERKKKLAEENMENILFNNELDSKIRNLDILISNERSVKMQQVKNAEANRVLKENIESEIRKKNDVVAQINSEEPLIRAWNLYLEMIGKNGIAKLVLRNALPVINREISRLLNGICDFGVELDMDDSNNVCINLRKDDVVMDLKTACSGLENTLSSLALRIALGNIGSMPKPSFIVMDEVLSGINHENVDRVKDLYKRILGGYDFIIHIVHDDIYNDMHDMEVVVVKEDNISRIEVRP